MLLAGHPENVRGTCCRPRAVLRARAVSEDSAESAVLLLSGLVSNAVLHLGSSEDWRAKDRTRGSSCARYTAVLACGEANGRFRSPCSKGRVGCSRGRVGWSPGGMRRQSDGVH